MNNFKQLKENLNFKEDGDFYFLQLFKRRKDHPGLEHPVIRLKSFCIYSLEELEDILPKIIDICEETKSRAYLRMNKQNAIDVSLRCIKEMADNLITGNASSNRNIWDSVSGAKGKIDYHMIDIDSEHIQHNSNIVEEIKSIIGQHFIEVRNENTEILTINTKTGVHLLLKPFDNRILNTINRQFMDSKISPIQILKDANTLLYSF